MKLSHIQEARYHQSSELVQWIEQTLDTESKVEGWRFDDKELSDSDWPEAMDFLTRKFGQPKDESDEYYEYDYREVYRWRIKDTFITMWFSDARERRVEIAHRDWAF